MNVIVKICIRLFLLFTVFKFINTFITSVANFISWLGFFKVEIKMRNIDTNDINIIDALLLHIPFILLWFGGIILIIFLWKKSEKIANKIVGKNEIEIDKINIDYNKLLSIGLIVIGVYLIIDTLPILFSYISNYIVSKTRFVDKDYLKEWSIKSVIEIIGVAIKIIISFVIIRYNDKVVEKIIDLKNKQSNVA